MHFKMMLLSVLLVELDRLEDVRLLGERGWFVADIVTLDFAVPFVALGRLPEDLQRFLVDRFDAHFGGSTAGGCNSQAILKEPNLSGPFDQGE